MAVCLVVAGASAQIGSYTQAKPKPKPFGSDIATYLPLIRKYVPGASLFLPAAVSTTAAPTTPPQQQELPKVDAPAPFYNQEPSTVLTPPQSYGAPSNTKYYQVPVPSQDLQAPGQLPWNPDNDPRYYFDNKHETPTDLYPKKYDKELHATVKPYIKGSKSQVRKKKQKKTEKVVQKKSTTNKVQNSEQQLHPGLKNEPQTAESGYLPGFDQAGYHEIQSGHPGHYSSTGYSDGSHSSYGHHPPSTGYSEGVSGVSHSSYGHHPVGYSDGGSHSNYGHHPSTGYNNDGGSHSNYGRHPSTGYNNDGGSHSNYGRHPSTGYSTDGGAHTGGYAAHHSSGYSDGGSHSNYGHSPATGFTDGGADVRAALSADGHHPHHPPKERLEFQLHGHDGPNSYKWGFDHGEG